MKVLYLNIFLLLSVLQCYSNIIIGKIVKVSDGDTVILLTDDKKQIKIRLYGIDAPEKGQDFSNKATNFVRELCYDKEVKVITKGKDKYRRVLGVIYVDSINVNEALVRNGLAWHYKYFDKSPRLDSLEREARKEKLNIWSLPNPIEPYEYRKKKPRDNTRLFFIY